MKNPEFDGYFEALTGFASAEAAFQYNVGYNRALRELRTEMSRAGIPSGKIDAIIDELEGGENNWYDTCVVGSNGIPRKGK